MTVVDNAGVEHEIRMFYRWPLIPFVPHFYVEMGNERWVVHRGGFGYADNAHVYMSPDQRNVVVAKQFEGSATVFVRFDIASETGIVERGHPRDYHDKGWKRVEWQRRR